MEILRTVAVGTPLAGCILGAGVVALLAQGLLLREAVRRRGLQRRMRLAGETEGWASVAAVRVPGTYLEVVALAALCLVPAATIASVHQARGLVTQGLAATTPELRARLLAEGWSGQLGAMSLGIVLLELAGGLGVLAWSLAFAARKQMAGLAHAARIAPFDARGADAWVKFPSPETETVVACAGSMAAIGLLPALHGAFAYCSMLTRRLATLGHLDAGERLRRIDTMLVEARRALESGITASQIGLGLAVATCAGLVWWRSPARARRQWLGRAERAFSAGGPGAGGDGGGSAAGGGAGTSSGGAAWGTLACLVVAGSLYLVARPLQAENEMPWPPVEPHGERVASTLRTPDVVGPDRLRSAPVLEVTPTTVRLDGADVDAEGCRARLSAKHPGGDQAGGDLIVVCDEQTPARRLNPYLAAAGASGHRRPILAFLGHETMRRPVLGRLEQPRVTGAETRIEDGGTEQSAATVNAGSVLSPEDFGICADLAARVVELRRSGSDVGLRLPTL